LVPLVFIMLLSDGELLYIILLLLYAEHSQTGLNLIGYQPNATLCFVFKCGPNVIFDIIYVIFDILRHVKSNLSIMSRLINIAIF